METEFKTRNVTGDDKYCKVRLPEFSIVNEADCKVFGLTSVNAPVTSVVRFINPDVSALAPFVFTGRLAVNPLNVRPVNVGLDAVAISCGNDNVVAPDPAAPVKIIWFAVPDNVCEIKFLLASVQTHEFAVNDAKFIPVPTYNFFVTAAPPAV